MPQQRYEIREMTRADVDLALDWAAEEGWNPGVHDADSFYAADPHGFFIGLLNDEPIGSISAVAYGQSYGFMGLYIVKPDYRGRGFGIQLWNKAIEYLSGRNIGLDGVVAQQENYKKSGFRLAYRNIRYRWNASPCRQPKQKIIPLSSVPPEHLVAYDTRLFGCERASFLSEWITRPGVTALGILDRGELRGYGVLRKCRVGYKIGPLFSENPDLARDLFIALTAELAEGAAVFMDPPEVNHASVRMVEEFGMTKVFETARMYNQREPDVPLQEWFGVTTFELG